jgi:hypothetical protein
VIDVEWTNAEKNTLRWRFTAPWTWDEFFKTQVLANGMIDEVPGKVDHIFETSNIQSLPANAILNLRQVIANRHKRNGVIVLVGAHTLVMSVLTIITNAIPGLMLNLQYVKTEAQALELIRAAQEQRSQEPA